MDSDPAIPKDAMILVAGVSRVEGLAFLRTWSMLFYAWPISTNQARATSSSTQQRNQSDRPTTSLARRFLANGRFLKQCDRNQKPPHSNPFTVAFGYVAGHPKSLSSLSINIEMGTAITFSELADKNRLAPFCYFPIVLEKQGLFNAPDLPSDGSRRISPGRSPVTGLAYREAHVA